MYEPHPEVSDLDADEMKALPKGERVSIVIPGHRARLVLRRTRQAQGLAEYEVLPGQHYSADALRALATAVGDQ